MVVLFNIVVFLLVLGLLVFFHELGHFIAAKACGIYVDRFSLGMPPRIFGMRLGETDYCVGALPLGGYVKMAGQEDTPLSDEEREATYGKVPPDRWFNKKPVWQRFIVIFAGPMMNFVLAILLYALVAGIGANVPSSDVDNRIGAVTADSPAATAPLYKIADGAETADFSTPPDATGWKTGDRILTINGKKIRSMADVAIDALLGRGETLDVVLERPQDDGTFTRYASPVEPARLKADDQHTRFGVAPFDPALVGAIVPGSPAEQAGLKKGDIIERANGAIIDKATFVDATEKTPQGNALTLLVDRGDQQFTQVVQPQTVGRIKGIAVDTQKEGEQSPVVIIGVSDELRKSGKYLPGDIIEKVDGQPATLDLLRKMEWQQTSGEVNVQVYRPPVMMGLLRGEERYDAKLSVEPVRAIGVELGVLMVYHRTPAAEVIPEAFKLSYQALERVVKTVAMLVKGGLSPRELGGPVMIFQVTTTAAQEGYWWLLGITAFISVNLCVFNLLPLPVLDGGLLMYLLVEGVRGKPLTPKVQERLQQVGLLLILCLFLFITFNDIARLVTTSLGGS